MGRRKLTVKQSAADNIAAIGWFIESKGMLTTADKFVDEAYDFFIRLANNMKSYTTCREPGRAAIGYKCVNYKNKYTVVFIETAKELTICEFISSKLIHW